MSNMRNRKQSENIILINGVTITNKEDIPHKNAIDSKVYIFNQFQEERLTQFKGEIKKAKETKEVKEAKEESAKTDRDIKNSDAPRLSTSRKKVNVIIGGNVFCDDPIRVLKGYGTQVNS